METRNPRRAVSRRCLRSVIDTISSRLTVRQLSPAQTRRAARSRLWMRLRWQPRSATSCASQILRTGRRRRVRVPSTKNQTFSIENWRRKAGILGASALRGASRSRRLVNQAMLHIDCVKPSRRPHVPCIPPSGSVFGLYSVPSPRHIGYMHFLFNTWVPVLSALFLLTLSPIFFTVIIPPYDELYALQSLLFIVSLFSSQYTSHHRITAWGISSLECHFYLGRFRPFLLAVLYPCGPPCPCPYTSSRPASFYHQ